VGFSLFRDGFYIAVVFSSVDFYSRFNFVASLFTIIYQVYVALRNIIHNMCCTSIRCRMSLQCALRLSVPFLVAIAIIYIADIPTPVGQRQYKVVIRPQDKYFTCIRKSKCT
jgi:hypothetical protein